MPFRWELSVKKEGQTIYRWSCDDSWFEDNLKESTKNGASYEAQKTKYYFEELPKSIISFKKFSNEEWIADDNYLKRNVAKTIQNELKKYNIVGQKAQAIINTAISKLTQGVAILSPFCLPPSGDELLYIPEINSFISYYSE